MSSGGRYGRDGKSCPTKAVRSAVEEIQLSTGEQYITLKVYTPLIVHLITDFLSTALLTHALNPLLDPTSDSPINTPSHHFL